MNMSLLAKLVDLAGGVSFQLDQGFRTFESTLMVTGIDAEKAHILEDTIRHIVGAPFCVTVRAVPLPVTFPNAYRARIKKCWDACHGVPTERLEPMILINALDGLQIAKAQLTQHKPGETP